VLIQIRRRLISVPLEKKVHNVCYDSLF
jgi:hypothetical protein